jgi:hypothetical protein
MPAPHPLGTTGSYGVAENVNVYGPVNVNGF